MRFILLASLACLLGASACAPAVPSSRQAADSERQCFFSSNVRNFRVTRDEVLYVRSSADDVFEIRPLGPCRDLELAQSIALVGSTSSLCTGDVATVGATPGRGERCRVRIAARLSEEQVAALPGRDRP
jgi:hypothetical protein